MRWRLGWSVLNGQGNVFFMPRENQSSTITMSWQEEHNDDADERCRRILDHEE